MFCNIQLFGNLTSTSAANSLLPQRNAIIDDTNITDYIFMLFLFK